MVTADYYLKQWGAFEQDRDLEGCLYNSSSWPVEAGLTLDACSPHPSLSSNPFSLWVWWEVCGS